MNLYGFVGNDGLNWTDFLGREKLPKTDVNLWNPVNWVLNPEEVEMKDLVGKWNSGKIKHAKETAEKCLKAKVCSYGDEGEYGTVERLGFARHSGWGGAADAVRHCVWTCEMTKSLGAKKAKGVADIHEAHNSPVPRGPKPPSGYPTVEDWAKSDTEMDHHNNDVGISIAKKNSSVDCCKACRAGIASGVLQVNSPGGYEWPKPGPSIGRK